MFVITEWTEEMRTEQSISFEFMDQSARTVSYIDAEQVEELHNPDQLETQNLNSTTSSLIDD